MEDEDVKTRVLKKRAPEGEREREAYGEERKAGAYETAQVDK